MQALTTNPGSLSPFHVAFPVHDLELARAFYGGTLGCPEGRSSDEWVDFNFYGHSRSEPSPTSSNSSPSERPLNVS